MPKNISLRQACVCLFATTFNSNEFFSISAALPPTPALYLPQLQTLRRIAGLDPHQFSRFFREVKVINNRMKPPKLSFWVRTGAGVG